MISFSWLFQRHYQLLQNVIFEDLKHLKTADLYFGATHDPIYSFAFPTTLKPQTLNLTEIKKGFSSFNPQATVYLAEEHVKKGFPEYLVRNHYTFGFTDTWMVFKRSSSKISLSKKPLVQLITPQTFKDYYYILSRVFADWSGNEKYLQICKDSITDKIKPAVSDLKSELYVIYEHGQPASAASLFFSKKLKTGYLHNDGTLKEFRNRGYQTALINHRVARLLAEGIETIYAIVEYGGTSWRNYVRCGFQTIQIAQFFFLKTSSSHI